MPADVPYPAPLDEGLPHDVWEKYIKTPPATPLPESQVIQASQDLKMLKPVCNFSKCVLVSQ